MSRALFSLDNGLNQPSISRKVDIYSQGLKEFLDSKPQN
jgi:hypothetical protein